MSVSHIAVPEYQIILPPAFFPCNYDLRRVDIDDLHININIYFSEFFLLAGPGGGADPPPPPPLTEGTPGVSLHAQFHSQQMKHSQDLARTMPRWTINSIEPDHKVGGANYGHSSGIHCSYELTVKFRRKPSPSCSYDAVLGAPSAVISSCRAYC